MLPTRNAPLTKYIKTGNIQGRPNFSMEKSEYVPINTVFDAATNLFNMAERISTVTSEGLNINKYFNIRRSSFASGDIVQYNRYKINFNRNVLELSQAKAYFDTSYVNSRGYVREFKQFSYRRAFEGKGFNVEGYRFGGIEKTLLVQGADIIRYMFTLKTKHIEDLQRALLNGKSLKSHWFTVFMTPIIPVVTHSKGYSKAFVTQFITPFEESGVEIVYMDNILERLSFTEVDTFKFSISATKRVDRTTEIKQTVLEFRKHELNKVLLQQSWDLAVYSKERFEVWKTTVKSIYLTRAYAEYIDETFYKDIPLVEGMMRELCLGEDTREVQTYVDGNWEKPEFFTSHIQNPLNVIFRVFTGMHNNQLPELTLAVFERHATRIQATLYGETKDYEESNEVFSFQEDSYYEIKDYKATYKSLSADYPESILYKNHYYRYHALLGAYVDNHDIHRERFLDMNTGNDLFLTTLSEFVGNKEQLPSSCNIYFHDVRILCTRINNILHSINTEAMFDMEVYLASRLSGALFFTNQGYDEMTVRVTLNNSHNAVLLPMQHTAMQQYFNLLPDNSVDGYTGESDSPPQDDIRERLRRRRDSTMEEAFSPEEFSPVSNDAQPIFRESDEVIREQVEAENEGETDIAETMRELGVTVDEMSLEEELDSQVDDSNDAEEEVSEAHASARAEEAELDAIDAAEEAIMDEDSNAQYEASEEASDEPDGSIFDEPVVTISDSDSTQGIPNES